MHPKDIKLKATDIKKAFYLMLGASLSFSIMSFFVKMSAETVSNNMIIFFRFGVSSFYILSLVIFRKLINKPVSLKTKHLSLHIIRAIVSFLVMLLFYYSLRYIPLVEGNLLILTNPLFIPIIAYFFMKKKTQASHWISIFIGFLGITLILKPGFGIFDFYSIYPLMGGFLAALSFIYVRKISYYDHHHTSMFYYFILAFILSAILSIFEWKTPDTKTLIFLLLAGIFGTSYQELLIRASVYAPAKITSALMYTSLVFSTILSFFFFDQIPDIITWGGITLVLIGSIITLQYAKN